MNICFIGYGNMAKALAQSFSQKANHAIYASAPSLTEGQLSNGVFTHSSNLAFLSKADLVILAVKPVKAAEVLKEIVDKLPTSAVLLSIAAGLSLDWLAKHCKPQQLIVRGMPNTPIAVGEGATPFIANDYIKEAQKNAIESLFKPVSLTIWLNHEEDMNAFTALSGSGPAYVYLFLEALAEAGQHLGLSQNIATEFALQTASGALSLLKKTALSPQTLRRQVTSPGGTTEAAIEKLQEQGFTAIIQEALEAACKKAQQLGTK